jgi:hypothetical protein
MKKILILISASIISACNTINIPQISAVEHYERCLERYSVIEQVARCGKESRNKYLTEYNQKRSYEGNQFVAYVDNLARDVKSNYSRWSSTQNNKNNNEAIRKLNLTIYKYHRDLENQRQAARKKAINDLIELGNSVGREVDEKNKEHQKRNERNRSTNPEDCRIGDDLWGNPRIEC